MKCVQCGRERKIGMARTEKFCTQRCIINWLEANPDKNVEDAMGDTTPTVPLSITNVQSLSSSPPVEEGKNSKQKPVSRALKNLQIDMALPGTKLPLPSHDESDWEGEGKSSDEGRARKKPRLTQATIVATRSTRRAQASPSTKSGKVTTPVGVKASGRSTQSSASSEKSTPSGGIKRLLSASAPHPSALKKSKTSTPAKQPVSAMGTPKAVTFNLGFVQNSQESQSPAATFSLVSLDQLSAPLGSALMSQQKTDVSIPSGNIKFFFCVCIQSHMYVHTRARTHTHTHTMLHAIAHIHRPTVQCPFVDYGSGGGILSVDGRLQGFCRSLC